MATILFILYLFAGCFLMTRLRFVLEAGLGTKTILFLFLIKIAVGCILGLVNHLLLHNHTDYDVYNNLGIVEYNILFSDPYRYFTDIFKSNYAEYGEYFGSSGSYWNDLRTGIIFKLLGIMDIFSRGNYYINSLFFNFFSFLGHIALYRVFKDVYPERKIPVIIGCFLLPSLLYFSSGIHKDLIVFTALAFFCYSLYFSLEKSFTPRKIFFLLLSFIIILLIRNFIAILLFPCAVAWFISRRYILKPAVVFSGLILVLISGCVMLNIYFPYTDPLRVVVNKQQAFISLGKANTEYKIDTLQPAVKSFIAATPRALRHSFLSPYPGEFNNVYINLFAAEMIVYVILFLLMFFFPVKAPVSSKEFILFGLVFTFLVFLFTGYITTNAGALIRYRSIYIPFLMIPVLCNINFNAFIRTPESGNTFH